MGDDLADTAEGLVAEAVGALFLDHLGAALHFGPFRRHDYLVAGTGPAALHHQLVDPVHGEIVLRDEDDIGAAGLAAFQGQPARRAPHRLHDEDAFVRAGRRPQAVHLLRDDVEGRLEAQGIVGLRQVFIDGLGDAHDVHAGLAQPLGAVQSAVAADDDEGIEPQLLDVFDDEFGAVVFRVKGALPGGAQHRTAVPVPRSDDVRVEGPDGTLGIRAGHIDVDQALPAVPDAEDFVADAPFVLQPLVHGRLDHPLQGRVKTGAVAPAGKDADAALFHAIAIIRLAGWAVKAVAGQAGGYEPLEAGLPTCYSTG